MQNAEQCAKRKCRVQSGAQGANAERLMRSRVQCEAQVRRREHEKQFFPKNLLCTLNSALLTLHSALLTLHFLLSALNSALLPTALLRIYRRYRDGYILKHVKKHSYGVERGEEVGVCLNRKTSDLVAVHGLICRADVGGVDNVCDVSLTH